MLVIGIILLFVGSCIVPAIAQNTEKSQPASRETWLYVGGSGPGNYTKIQDAINASSDGDTVYVYDDSSPYYENITVKKSINLFGENKETTVINGLENNNVIYISADLVTISGFTIKSNYKHGTGIYIVSPNNTIHDNIIRNNPECGILCSSGDNRISKNIISDNYFGIRADGSHNIIQDNLITTCVHAVIIGRSTISFITKNSIKNNVVGIYGLESFVNVIYRNEITQNDLGIDFTMSGFNLITKNNIYNNSKDADFYCMVPFMNIWTRNYWGLIFSPIKIIKGSVLIFEPGGGYPPSSKEVPWFDFDLLPRRIPY